VSNIIFACSLQQAFNFPNGSLVVSKPASRQVGNRPLFVLAEVWLSASLQVGKSATDFYLSLRKSGCQQACKRTLF
jgi:hypothetical protein